MRRQTLYQHLSSNTHTHTHTHPHTHTHDTSPSATSALGMFVTSQRTLGSLGRWSGASITYTNKFKYKFSKIRALAYLLHKVTIGARIIYKYKFK